MKTATQNVTVDMSGTALGVMGPAGDRTMVRRTTDGRFAVLTVAAPHRVIKVFGDQWAARSYNAAIHGEQL